MKNNRAILLTGIRGVGKTTLGQSVLRHNPRICLINRDEFYATHFCFDGFEHYDGTLKFAEFCLFEHIREVLEVYGGPVIIDYFTGGARSRKSIIHDLRKMGFEEVHCWFVDTPKHLVANQFAQREAKPDDPGDFADHVRRSNHNYDLFYTRISDIFPDLTEEEILYESELRILKDRFPYFEEHFDEVRVIDMLQPLLPDMSYL